MATTIYLHIKTNIFINMVAKNMYFITKFP